jgi:hypothetical protein
MKHITYGDKSLLLGDETADLLLEYAALLTSEADGDTVTVNAVSSDGDEVSASFLLGPGATMMAETAHTSLPEPDNRAALEYMKEAMMRLLVRPAAAPEDSEPLPSYDDTSATGDTDHQL